MASRESRKSRHVFLYIILTLPLINSCENPDRKKVYVGNSNNGNVFITTGRNYYFGSRNGIPKKLPEFNLPYDNCLDAVDIAFSLDPNVIHCGNFTFSFKIQHDGKILAQGTCTQSGLGKCLSDGGAITYVEYTFVKYEMPKIFRYRVSGIYDEAFYLSVADK